MNKEKLKQIVGLLEHVKREIAAAYFDEEVKK